MIAILENERMLEAEPAVRLSAFFKSKDPAVRARAALAAGRIGNKAVIPDLKMLAEDRDTEVRKMTAFALGQIRAREGLETVAALMKDPDLGVRRLAVEAAGRIGALESTPLVVPFLDDPAPAIREQAALALALIKDRGTVDLLVHKSLSDDPAQWSYVYALYRLAEERSLPALHQVLDHASASPSTGDPSSLLFALKALWSMKKPLDAQETEKLLQHQAMRVQQNALDVLATAGDAAACSGIRNHIEALQLPSKVKALEALAALKCATVEEKMKYLGRPEPQLRAAAMKLIGDKEGETYLPVFDRSSRDDSWLVREQAAQSSAGLSADSALPILKRLMKDSDSSVRLAAVESLGSFLPRAEDQLLPFLQSSDSPERSIVVDALGKTKDRKYLPMILQMYDTYSDLDTRTSVLDALAEYGDSAALKVLEHALKDPRYVLRRHAVDALKKLAGGSAYSLNGKVVNLDDFLSLEGKVSAATQAKYAANFGSPAADRQVILRLEKGPVTVRLLGREAPVHVQNFLNLAQKGFYNGLRIHRVVPNFVIQGGDPRGDGWGSAGELVPDQFNPQPYLRGSVGMPTAGKDTGGSQ
ncbi:MAG TPA: HEAT repeat domain-containing protein, partial [Acidobacteriota bacterium]|nr:HEAT repeat domain-containing protein [Acidobacteriota bacterium]